MSYKSFSKKCVKELKLLQEVLHNDYDLNSYENWFYNQTTGLITFSTGEKQINFNYADIGSFHPQSNTWNWSWNNEDTLEKVKEKSNLIKTFGEENGFSKLSNGYFESDEIEAWEFASIALKIIKGIGVYRPVSDEELQIFLVLIKIVDNETAQNIKDKYVECGEHEYCRRAFVCQHLNKKTAVGFEESFETYIGMELDEEDDFQAWCNKCEVERQKEDGWNDISMEFAKIKVVCEQCYFDMKALNLGK